MRILLGCIIGVSCLILSGSLSKSKSLKVIFNRTSSAPIGFYWVNDSSVIQGDWAIVSHKSDAALRAQMNGYIGMNWPMIKQVSALNGDETCRFGSEIFINNLHVAKALKQSRSGFVFPSWSGCFVLTASEVFLLNDNPNSLDGRYLGVMHLSDLEGRGRLIWKTK